MARRGENLYKRKDGRWEGRLLVQKGTYRYFYGKSYKEAKDKMRRYQEDTATCIEKQSQQANSAAGELEAWLKGDGCLQVKPSTYESYYHCIHKHILPFFQEKQEQQITRKSVMEYTKALREKSNLADASKKKILSVFKIALKEILKNEPDKAAILELVKLPKLEMKEVEVFSLKEQRILEATAIRTNDRRALGIVLCLYSGIRLGELCALTWKDIDSDTGMMSITKTICRTKNFEHKESRTALLIGTPKSRNSMRKIPLPAFLLTLTKKQKKPGENENTYLLTGSNTPIDPRSFQKFYKRILAETNLPDRKFHALRHTFATRGLELGVDIKTLSEILGHSNASITLNIYAHSLVEQKRAAIEKYNDLHNSAGEYAKFAV